MWYCSEAGNRERGTGNAGFLRSSPLAVVIAFLQPLSVHAARIAGGRVDPGARTASFPVPRSPFPAQR